MAQFFSDWMSAAAAACALALACGASAAGPLDGCWKMVDARSTRQSGKVDASTPDCIRAYKESTLVTACRGGKDVSVYALTDMTVGSYSFAQAGKEGRGEAGPPRAAAFLIKGPTLHMVLGKGSASADPIVRTEQQLKRLDDKECAALRRYLPEGPAGGDAKPRP